MITAEESERAVYPTLCDTATDEPYARLGEAIVLFR
jgi:hypothetical protein